LSGADPLRSVLRRQLFAPDLSWA